MDFGTKFVPNLNYISLVLNIAGNTLKIRFSVIIALLLLVCFSLQTPRVLSFEGSSAKVLTQTKLIELGTEVNNYARNYTDNVIEIVNDTLLMFNQTTIIHLQIKSVFEVQHDNNLSDEKCSNKTTNDHSFIITIKSPEQSWKLNFTTVVSDQIFKAEAMNLSTKPAQQTPIQMHYVGSGIIKKDSFTTFLKLHLTLRLSDDHIYPLTITILVQVGRLSETVILSNEKRRKIYEYLKKHPGAHLREITKNFGLGVHAVKWHLSVLERFRFIGHDRCGRYLIFYPTGRRPSRLQVQIRIALLNKNAAKILGFIASNPGITQVVICRQLKLHKNTVNYHVQKLTTQGIIEKIKCKKNVRLYITEAEHKVDGIKAQT